MMAQDPSRVLVIGATGQQGGALARRLLERGHSVRGMTRDPSQAAAEALQAAGAEMVKGFLLDADSVARAAEGMEVAFLVTTPFGPAGPEGEVRQGTTAVDALARAGVQHIVFASVANADRETGVPHYDSKRRIEEHIVDQGIPATIVAPVYFRENVRAPWCLRGDELQLPLPAERSLQNISVAEVGAFHAHVVENRFELMGERIDIASDANTPVQMAAAIGHAAKQPFRFQRIQYMDVQEMSGELARTYEWFDRVGFRVDIAALRERFPEVPWMSFREWADGQDWSMVEPPTVEEDDADDGADGAAGPGAEDENE